MPSFFTLMNLFSGFIALIQAHNGNFSVAAWLIVLAAFFDLLDGMVARMANATSAFGVELDSLCDAVSFGAAPSFLVYTYGLSTLGEAGVLLAALPAICGVVRLARFNVTFTEKKDYFIGLPIPAQAMTVVAFILTFNGRETWFNRFELGELSILIPLVIVLAALMVSNVRFAAMPKPNPAYIRAHPKTFVAFVVGVLLVLFLQEIGLFLALVGYLVWGIAGAVIRTLEAIREADPSTEDIA